MGVIHKYIFYVLLKIYFLTNVAMPWRPKGPERHVRYGARRGAKFINLLILIPAALIGPEMSSVWILVALPGAGRAKTSMLVIFAARMYRKLTMWVGQSKIGSKHTNIL